MPNILDRFFEDASSRIATQPVLSDQDLPRPDSPEHDGFDPTEIASDNDDLIPVEDRWSIEVGTRRLADREIPFPITSEDRDLLDGGIREVGFDVYAFYKSRRHVAARPYPGKWGIFYLEHGVSRVKELIESTYPGYGSSLRLAYEFLREHERFHFKFDIYALSVEAKIGRALYEPLKRAFRHHRIHQVEEALANRDAWEWAKRGRVGLGEFAYDFMKLQPGAYARFDERKFDLAGELAANLIDLNLSSTARREDQALWIGNVPDELLRRSLCPEYFVRPSSLTAWINPAWKLPEVRNVTEAQSFSSSLASKYASLKERWEDTKRKLIANPALPGLDFKRWDKSTGHWSVRINDNFRAHLRPIPKSGGTWEAEEFGPHKAMGHG
ncbi:MAG: hypothetical protein HYZ17_01460 [Betaproteobacteria bacterium]|nr:hypothetical protein [Betaproteobacteria bacterium]